MYKTGHLDFNLIRNLLTINPKFNFKLVFALLNLSNSLTKKEEILLFFHLKLFDYSFNQVESLFVLLLMWTIVEID
jgi:hypothetical protein